MKQIITIGQLMFQNYVNDITFPFTRGIPIAWLSDSINKDSIKDIIEQSYQSINRILIHTKFHYNPKIATRL
jgi:hypothetical protein